MLLTALGLAALPKKWGNPGEAINRAHPLPTVLPLLVSRSAANRSSQALTISQAPQSRAACRHLARSQPILPYDVGSLNPLQLSLARRTLHCRLEPFWSTALPHRRVLIATYIVDLSITSPSVVEARRKAEPLTCVTVATNSDGHFSHDQVVPWEKLSNHPISMPMASSLDHPVQQPMWGVRLEATLLADGDARAESCGRTTSSLTESLAYAEGRKADAIQAQSLVGCLPVCQASGLAKLSSKRAALSHAACGSILTASGASIASVHQDTVTTPISISSGIRLISDIVS